MLFGNVNSDLQGLSRGVSQVSRNWSGFLYWHIMPIYSNKAIKVYGFMTRLITPFSMFILVHFCLPREDLEEDQRDPRPPYFTRFKKSC